MICALCEKFCMKSSLQHAREGMGRCSDEHHFRSDMPRHALVGVFRFALRNYDCERAQKAVDIQVRQAWVLKAQTV